MSVILNNIGKENISDILSTQIFWIGKEAEIKVTVYLYEKVDNSIYLAAWINNKEVVSTEYTGLMDTNNILFSMEQFIDYNENDIIKIAKGE